MRRLNFFVGLLFFCLFLQCWKRQDHEITKPATPMYVLTGQTLDIDSHIKLKNCAVKLDAQSLVYDASFPVSFDTSDTNGQYQFEHVIPGQYILTVAREAYDVLTVNVQIEHADQQLDIQVPKVILSSHRYDYNHNKSFGTLAAPRLYGIHWLNSNTLAGNWVWQEFADDIPRWRVISGNFNSGFNIVGEHSFSPENPTLNGLTYIYNYYSSRGNRLLKINPGTGKVFDEIKTDYTIADLTTDQKSIWVTVSDGKIVQFNNAGTNVLNVYDVPYENPGGLAWNGDVFWSYSLSENLLYKHTASMEIEKTFRPIYVDNSGANYQLSDIKYMTFNDGYLWLNDTNAIYTVLTTDK
ncbi:carboxypeptidase regulatory-like domain-containing protein [candidate division KSB1 bacterium]|nr:carboxypeptidase regulatory-like domain-containing protein [candidate division KSB1 bacterium]